MSDLRTLPTFHPLVLNAKRLLCLSQDDCERLLPVIVLRALSDLADRHERAVQEAYERGRADERAWQLAGEALG